MRQFFLVMACLLLAACSRGPDVNTLEADVKARLAALKRANVD